MTDGLDAQGKDPPSAACVSSPPDPCVLLTLSHTSTPRFLSSCFPPSAFHLIPWGPLPTGSFPLGLSTRAPALCQKKQVHRSRRGSGQDHSETGGERSSQNEPSTGDVDAVVKIAELQGRLEALEMLEGGGYEDRNPQLTDPMQQELRNMMMVKRGH